MMLKLGTDYIYFFNNVATYVCICIYICIENEDALTHIIIIRMYIVYILYS